MGILNSDSPFTAWYHFSILEGRVIGSEHPENLHFDDREKREISRRIAQYLNSEHKIRAVINLTEAAWSYGVGGMAEYHFPLSDNRIDGTSFEELKAIVDTISTHIEAGENVWVHCQQGIDRTGCAIGCYLVTLGMDPSTAISLIKENWSDRRKSKPMYHELWEPSAKRIREFASFLRAEI